MKIEVATTRAELGRTAAHDIAAALREGLRRQHRLRLILAAAPSQADMLTELRAESGVDWERVTAFQMDEYIGLSKSAPQRFANWLQDQFVRHIPLGRFEAIDPSADPEAACIAYAALLAKAPIDVVLLGIGTNGHLAFNDPPADLHDPLAVKVVTLDEVCRQQQVLDGCFRTLEEVPQQAITLTIPTLLSGERLFCCVPGLHKRAAVQATLESPISGECPATALRLHPRCTLYLDAESNATSQ